MTPFYRPALIGLAAPLILLAGCETSTPLKRVADLPPGVAGIWKSNGYGYILDASEEFPRLFHYTPEICIEDAQTAAQLTHYLTPDNLAYDNEGRAIYFSSTFEDYKIELAAIPNRPQICDTKQSNDPVRVFESFASYMKTHYAFFDLYGVNWDNAVISARSKLSPQMSDGALYAVLTDLLRPLKDGHIELNAQVGGQEMTYEPGQSTVGDAIDRMVERDGVSKQKLNNKMMQTYWLSGVKKDILEGKGKMGANDTIQYGVISGDIGYFAVIVEGGYSDQGEGFEADDLAVLQAVMDDAISTFNNAEVKSVIIDLSVNLGGYNFIAREIAGRFAQKRTLGYTKYASDATNHTPFPIYIEPHHGPRFTGPVVLVTSNVTLSAGEMLTMGLRALPNVTHVGEVTRGANSDVLTKKLPNGWTIDLSNEIYHDHMGKLWEGRGIPPHIPIQIFNRDNPFIGHVDAIEAIVTRIDDRELSHP